MPSPTFVLPRLFPFHSFAAALPDRGYRRRADPELMMRYGRGCVRRLGAASPIRPVRAMNGTITARIRKILRCARFTDCPNAACNRRAKRLSYCSAKVRSGRRKRCDRRTPPRWPRRAASCHDALGALARSGAALSPLRCLAQRMYRLRAPPQGACAVSMENPPAT